MKFTIDYSSFIIDTKRLKVDGNFKEITNEKQLYADDLQFNSYMDADNWLKRNQKIRIGNELLETKPSGHHLLGSPTFSVRLHRITKPKKPYVTISEIRKLLLSGDDSHYNMLVLDYDGFPHLISNPSKAYAVRLEGFAAGNGYVGVNSKLNHLNDTYQSLLEAWLLHLESNESIYRDYSEYKLSQEELIKKILKVIENFK